MTNIALVVLDTVRNDTFQDHFTWMPGTYFSNTWSTSHRTPPVHASLFTGQYGSEVGVVPDSDSLSCNQPVLAELLRDNGYSTRGYSANPYITSHFDFDRGFSEFHTTWKLDILSPELFNWETFATEHKSEGAKRYPRGLLECIRSDAKTLASLKRGMEIKLRDLGFNVGPRDDGATEIRNFVDRTNFGNDEFLFLNLMEAHEPYTSPSTDGKTQFKMPTTVELTFQEHDLNTETVQNAYEDAVSYLSDTYHEIFDYLAKDFDIIVTCGDHGELFGKRGIWGHFHGVDPELVNVPLHVYRGEEAMTECSRAVSLLDVYTTILELAGIEETNSRGMNAFTDNTDPKKRLVECRGISQKRIDQIRHDSDATERTQSFENELFGAVVPPKSYAYEHIEGVEVNGELSRKEAKSIIDILISDLDVENSEIHSVQSDVQSHLEDLGYV